MTEDGEEKVAFLAFSEMTGKMSFLMFRNPLLHAGRYTFFGRCVYYGGVHGKPWSD